MTVLHKDDPEIIRKYEEYHAHVWPGVLAGGYKMGLRRCLIYRYDRQLFMFLETLDEFDMQRDAAQYLVDPNAREWGELMRSFQEPAPGEPKGTKWVEMKEIHAIVT